jgi:hypothetical protein
MQRNEEDISKEEEDEFGVLRSGRRYKKLNIGVEEGAPVVSMRGENHVQ